MGTIANIYALLYHVLGGETRLLGETQLLDTPAHEDAAAPLYVQNALRSLFLHSHYDAQLGCWTNSHFKSEVGKVTSKLLAPDATRAVLHAIADSTFDSAKGSLTWCRNLNWHRKISKHLSSHRLTHGVGRHRSLISRLFKRDISVLHKWMGLNSDGETVGDYRGLRILLDPPSVLAKLTSLQVVPRQSGCLLITAAFQCHSICSGS